MGFPETYEIDSGNGFYKQIGNAVGLWDLGGMFTVFTACLLALCIADF